MSLRFVVLAAGALLGSASVALAQTAPVETRGTYVARCQQELVAQYPGARGQAGSICATQWDEVVAAGPMADAIFGAAPAVGQAFNPTAARTRFAGLGRVRGQATASGVTLSWSAPGEPIPFRLEDALRGRGAALSMVGCLAYGASESTRVYRVAAPGRAPFALTIAARNAALASQSSDFQASAVYGGPLPTLAALNRNGDGYEAACPA